MPNGYSNEELAEICDACKEPKGKHYPRADWLCPKQNTTYFTSKPSELDEVVLTQAEALACFQKRYGKTAEQFMKEWKADEVPDTFETNQILGDALFALQEDEKTSAEELCAKCGFSAEDVRHSQWLKSRGNSKAHSFEPTVPTHVVIPARPHIIDGEFQSDKYPTCPRGKVPLSVKDPMAQDLLMEYARRRKAIDPQFSDDLEFALHLVGVSSSYVSDEFTNERLTAIASGRVRLEATVDGCFVISPQDKLLRAIASRNLRIARLEQELARETDVAERQREACADAVLKKEEENNALFQGVVLDTPLVTAPKGGGT